MNHLSQDLSIALKAARLGSHIVRDDFGKQGLTLVKDQSKGLVTNTDLEAEKVIVEVLKEHSNYDILSEECGTLKRGGGPVWVIDPLDGTNNFARSIPLFAVSVGLIYNDLPILGVIIDPIRNNEYYAIKGGGAFLNGKRIVLPDFKLDYLSMIFLNHGYAGIDRNKFKVLSGVLASEYNILKLGTTALELCFISSGSVDAFIASGGEVWDFAAGVLIAKESGYKISDWQGEEWISLNNNLLISREEIHDKLIKLIN